MIKHITNWKPKYVNKIAENYQHALLSSNPKNTYYIYPFYSLIIRLFEVLPSVIRTLILEKMYPLPTPKWKIRKHNKFKYV